MRAADDGQYDELVSYTGVVVPAERDPDSLRYLLVTVGTGPGRPSMEVGTR